MSIGLVESSTAAETESECHPGPYKEGPSDDMRLIPIVYAASWKEAVEDMKIG